MSKKMHEMYRHVRDARQPPPADKPTQQLRAELMWLRGRYDDGAIRAGIYGVVKSLEVDIAWKEYERKGYRR
jgi:hypothetical protein